MTATSRVLAAVVSVVAAAGACEPGRPPPTGEACALPSSIAATPAASASAPDGGGLRLVGKGFTQTGDTASVGAILENTSALVAYRTRIVLRLFDSSGAAAQAESSPQLVQEIPIIQPGQRVGAGAFTYLKTAGVASIEVEVLLTSWLAPSQLAGLGHVTGTYLQVRRFDPADPESAYLDYTVSVASCRGLRPRMVAAIYRDHSGTIIGGTIEASAGRGEHVCRPGEHSDWLGARGLPSTIDPARTEFFPYCDPGAQASAPSGLPQPWN